MTSSKPTTALSHKSGNGQSRSRKIASGASSAGGTRLDIRVYQPELLSTPAHIVLMSPEALSNNEKLFPTFRAQLSDITYEGSYASSAEKLAGWLSRDKAYYEAARHWVSSTVVSS